MPDELPVPLIDIDDAATMLGIPPDLARIYLDTQRDPPVASYRGKPLWLRDTVDDLLTTASGQ